MKHGSLRIGMMEGFKRFRRATGQQQRVLVMLADMKGLVRFIAMVAAGALLAACTPNRSVVVQRSGGSYGSAATGSMARPAPGGSYTVVKGDTLYAIAFQHGVDGRSLASWNQIEPPYTIWPGQQLRLGPDRAAAGTGGSYAGHAPAPKPALAAKRQSASASVIPAAPTSAHATPANSRPMFEPVVSTPIPAAPAASLPVSTPMETTVPVAGEPSAQATPPLLPPSAAPPAAGGIRTIDGVTWRWPADGSVFKKFQSGDAIPGIEVSGRAGDPVRAAADGVVVYSGNGLVGYGELVIIKHNDSFLSAYGHNSKRLVKEGQRVQAGQIIAEMGSTGASRDELQFQIRKNGNPVDPLQYLPAR